MPRYKLSIEYEGTRYSGWQKQPNAQTIEEVLENTFSRILQQPIDIIGQGRTDSGVHAEAQVAHVDVEEKLEFNTFLYALAGVLPRDIAVWKIEETSPSFHARFDAVSRQYRYQIVTRPSPLWRNFAVFEANTLNIVAMQKCAQMIKGEHDFENFSKTDKDQTDAICNVLLSIFKKEDHLIIYRIRADRFVRHMVRRLMGTMLQVGKGKLSVDDFAELLHKPAANITSQGITAKGLILEKVDY